MVGNRANMREWLRIRLGIITPLQRWDEWGGPLNPDTGPMPQPGDQPDWSPIPSNRTLDSSIESACSIVNRQANLSGVHIRNLPIEAQSGFGPYSFNLGSVEGYAPRSVMNVRRCWWNTGTDGSTAVRLNPRNVGDLDRRGATYIADAVGLPFEYWVEGYDVFIHPAPSAAGVFQWVSGDGLLAPQTDTDMFDPVPGSYDEAILYIALVELGKMLPSDSEMIKRAQVFGPDAAQGLNDVQVWWSEMSNEEPNPTLIFDARIYRRWPRRR